MSALAIVAPERYPMCPNAAGAQPHVETEHGIGLRIVEGAFLDHQGRPAFLSAGRALFGRLKDELHRAGQLILHAGKQFRDAHENGNVIVVAARVHHADLLPVVGRFHLRRKRHVHQFSDGQAVHVGSKRHHLARLAALQHTDDAGMRDAGSNFDPEASKMVGHHLGRARFTIAQLRMLMKIATPPDHLVCDLFGAPVDFCGRGTLRV